MSLGDLAQFFDIQDLSPGNWPVSCNVTIPNTKAFQVWPDWPKAALPEAGRAASGHGENRQRAIISGLGEAVEIASLCRWGKESTVVARRDDLPGDAWGPEELNGFSQAQTCERNFWNQQLIGTDWIPPNPAVEELEWVMACKLDGAPVWVPAEAVFLGQQENGSDDAHCIADTNGCAAGATDRAAQSNALFELVERDATGRWWYGMRSRRLLDISRLDETAIRICSELARDGRATLLFDITTDLGIPAVAAVCAKSGDRPVGVGFSAAPKLQNAARKALCEMAQMLLVFEFGKIGTDARPGLARWIAEVGFEIPPIAQGKDADAKAAPHPTGSVAARLSAAGVRIAFVNQTRAKFGVPVWRALSPDLCHWKPRFGRPRLLAADTQDQSAVSALANPVLLRI